MTFLDRSNEIDSALGAQQQQPGAAPSAPAQQAPSAFGGRADELSAALAGQDPFKDLPKKKGMTPDDVSADVAKSAGIGAVEGAIGLPNMFGDAAALAREGTLKLIEKFGGNPEAIKATRDFYSKNAGMYGIPSGSRETQKLIEQSTGPFYQPKSTAGQYARTGAQFAVGAAAGPSNSLKQTAGNVVRYGLAPGAVSETAGQLFDDTWFGPWARGISALVTGGVLGALRRPGTPEAALATHLPNWVTDENLSAAGDLMKRSAAAENPVRLTLAEALSQVTGRPVFQDLQRILESAPQSRQKMQDFFANRPQEVQAATRAQLENIGPQANQPSLVGEDVSQAARAGVAQQLPGEQLAAAKEAASARMTPEQAGQVIQPELRQVYERREGMRNAQGDKEFDAARQAPENVPLNGGFGFRDVTEVAEPKPVYPVTRDVATGRMRRMTGDELARARLERIIPVQTSTRDKATGRFRRLSDDEIEAETQKREADLAADRAKQLGETSTTRRLPVIGLQPTEFGQVDPRPVIQGIDAALESAKGDTASLLKGVRGTLHRPDGQIDTSVQGLENARDNLGGLITKAKQAGDNHAVTELQKVAANLKTALESVPSHAEAVKGYKAASEPLKPFAEGTIPGQIVEHDQFNEKFKMPPEQVPAALDRGGPSAVRDFLAVASPKAREAYESHVMTQTLDSATQGGAVSAEKIRNALRDREDLFNQLPAARQRLETLASSQEAVDRLSATPLGQLALKNTTTKKAMDVLFSRNPLPGSEGEIGSAVGAVAKNNPWAARQLVRTHAEAVFNEASRSLGAEGNQFTGAKFSIQIAGNPQQRANLQAAVEALPNGQARWQGFNNFLDTLEATGQRQPIGSRTSFNTQELKELSQVGGGHIRTAQTITAPREMANMFRDKLDEFRLKKNLDMLADMVTSDKSIPLLKRMAAAPPGSKLAQLLTFQLLTQQASYYRGQATVTTGDTYPPQSTNIEDRRSTSSPFVGEGILPPYMRQLSPEEFRAAARAFQDNKSPGKVPEIDPMGHEKVGRALAGGLEIASQFLPLTGAVKAGAGFLTAAGYRALKGAEHAVPEGVSPSLRTALKTYIDRGFVLKTDPEYGEVRVYGVRGNGSPLMVDKFNLDARYATPVTHRELRLNKVEEAVPPKLRDELQGYLDKGFTYKPNYGQRTIRVYGPMTDNEQRNMQIMMHYKAGRAPTEIARDLGVTPGTVAGVVHRQGSTRQVLTPVATIKWDGQGYRIRP